MENEAETGVGKNGAKGAKRADPVGFLNPPADAAVPQYGMYKKATQRGRRGHNASRRSEKRRQTRRRQRWAKCGPRGQTLVPPLKRLTLPILLDERSLVTPQVIEQAHAHEDRGVVVEARLVPVYGGRMQGKSCGALLLFFLAVGCGQPPGKTANTPQSTKGATSTTTPSGEVPKDTAPPPKTDPPAVNLPVRNPRDLQVGFDGKNMVLQGKKLSDAPKLSDFVQILGEADRIEDKVNRIHVYERMGIILYEPHNGTVIATNVYFTPESFSFVPKSMFAGTAAIDTLKVDARTTQLELITIGAKRDPIFNNYKLEGSGYSLILGLEKGTETLSYIAVAFPGYSRPGVDTKKTSPTSANHPAEDFCLRGNAAKCVEASLAYQTGAGVPKDGAKAYTFAKLACDGGAAFGCTNQAMLLERGEGVASDRVAAKALFEKACKMKDQVACLRLGK